MTMNVSQARQRFLELVNRVYAGEEFLITKNKIPVLTISPIRKENKIKKTFKRKIDPKIFGMWKNRKDFKGMSTIEIADMLREKAWKGNYDV